MQFVLHSRLATCQFSLVWALIRLNVFALTSGQRNKIPIVRQVVCIVNTQNIGESWVNLKLDHLSLTFLVTAQLEMLGTFDGNLLTPLALGALQTQHQLFGCLCLKKIEC